ncbi:MAG: hypothetical protein P4L87_03365 [Formivibrio sp.]|nr:hypothetical protein [Formivibrio sp.]
MPKSVELFTYQPPGSTNVQVLWRADELGLDADALKFAKQEIDNVAYLPQYVLFLGMQESHTTHLPLFEVVKQHPHVCPFETKVEDPVRGMLAPELESAGFELVNREPIVMLEKYTIFPICWRPNLYCPPIRVAELACSNDENGFQARWLDVTSPEWNWLAQENAMKRFPDATQALTAAGIEYIRAKIAIHTQVHKITGDTWIKLSKYAYNRLKPIKCLSTAQAEDVVQEALIAVITGERNPLPHNVADNDAFTKYLRGVVKSKIFALKEHARKIRFDEMPEPSECDIPSLSAENPFESVAIGELKEELFAYLKANMPARHQETIEAWRNVFEESDRIPAIKGRRKYVAEIRAKTQEFIRQYNSLNSEACAATIATMQDLSKSAALPKTLLQTQLN